ncbi:endonuclease III homologue, putative [Plasmodium gallinaceum]|uniref:Endonuclease III homolog n=1 Tax=Plasmodium gallinaceum TaxID=5849 RepID=A0A1J1GMU2_PLAGA|nr:endonuclease III homologue, putative [Plasmodium gallinaceum]CRG93729.1 endonuclease III homologue, putative [Plasmodium gallinaceum]
MKLLCFFKRLFLVNLYFIKMEKPSKYFSKNKIKKIRVKYEEIPNNTISNVKKLQLEKNMENYQVKDEIMKSNIKGDNSLMNMMKLNKNNEIIQDNHVKNSEQVQSKKPLSKIRVKKEYGVKRKMSKSEINNENNKNILLKNIEKDENMNNYDINLKKEHFLFTYNKIKEMRKNIIAPVDKYGCNKLSEKTDDLKVYRFQTLISCLLSSRTKDEVTAMVMDKLKKHGLTVENILNTSEEYLKKLIYGIGFYNVKAKQIIQICHILKNKYNSDIPNNYEELKKLPGVGEKIAQLILQAALDKHEGIAVDIHVHRIANRLNWVNTKNELNTQKNLKNYVQKDLWSEINTLLVGFGQVICKGKKPICEKCTLTNYCQYYKENLIKKKK